MFVKMIKQLVSEMIALGIGYVYSRIKQQKNDWFGSSRFALEILPN